MSVPRPANPIRERAIPTFVGPLSLLGVCVGMIAWLLPVLYGAELLWLLAVPLSGLLCVALPVRSVRHLGLGLIASFLVWPITVLGFLGIATLVG